VQRPEEIFSARIKSIRYEGANSHVKQLKTPEVEKTTRKVTEISMYIGENYEKDL